MTRRAWGLLAIGLAAAAALAGFAFAHRGSAAPFRPSASWNMYPPREWQRLVAGTRLTGVHVVAATAKRNGTPVTLLAGKRGAATCFVPVDGMRLARPSCDPQDPLTVFRVRDDGFVDVVGVASHTVASVAQTVRLHGTPYTAGAALVAVGRYFVFGGGARGSAATLTARDARGRIVARLHLRR